MDADNDSFECNGNATSTNPKVKDQIKMKLKISIVAMTHICSGSDIWGEFRMIVAAPVPMPIITLKAVGLQ